MDKILNNWNDFLNEQTEPFQQKMKAKHPRLKNRVIGHGGQQNTPPFTEKPSMKRSKSAPPIGEQTEIDEGVKDYLKGAALGAGLSLATGLGAGAYNTSQRMDAAQHQRDLELQKESAPTKKFEEMRNSYTRLFNIFMSGAPKTKEESEIFRQRLEKRLAQTFSDIPNPDKAAKYIVDRTVFNNLGKSYNPTSGTGNLRSFLDACILVKMKHPEFNNTQMLSEANRIWNTQAMVDLKNELNIKTNIAFGPQALDSESMGSVQWKHTNESKKIVINKIISEIKFKDLAKGKDTWTKIDPALLKNREPKEVPNEEDLNDELYDIIDTSYKYVGGHASFKNADDLPHDYDGWAAIDVDSDDSPDALRIWKTDKVGDTKMVGGGSDGSEAGKKAYLDNSAEMLRSSGTYGEMSGAVAHVMLTRYRIPPITNQETVEKVLGKKVKWIGKHPEGKYPEIDGWYEREINGTPHMKIMLGNPSLAERLVKETIVKKGSKFCLKSKKSGKNLGCYPTKGGAKKREKQVQYFKHVNEVYEIDEGVFSDIATSILKGKAPQQEPQKDYQDFNEVYKNIYVGSAPIRGGKPITSLLHDKRFDTILVMSTEVADIIKKYYESYKKPVPPKFKMEYAVRDVEDPTQDEIAKLKAAALYVRLISKQRGVLVTCNKGLNRSATVAALALTGMGISPDEAIQKVKAARGNNALTLNGKPHAGFLPLINQKND